MTPASKIRSHEAGHAAGLIWNGHLPRIVRADHSGPEDYNGAVHPDLGDGIDRDLAGDLMLSVLLGGMCEGDGSWPPLWSELDHGRLKFKVATGDALALVRLVEYLDMDEDGYDAMVGIALHVRDDANFKAIHALIADALDRAPFITGPQLRTLLGPELVASYELETAKEAA
ncbi:MAG: hypothetical protein ACRDMH_13220 [Solirubrobacterales bacterium]